MWVTEDTLSAPASDASGEGIGIVETLSTEGVEHVTDRNRFILHVLLFNLLKTSNCYPLDSPKSRFFYGR